MWSEMQNYKLNPCPCGKIPEFVTLTYGYSSKWGLVMGNCCSEWMVEFRTGFQPLDSKEAMDAAVEAWNAAPRKPSSLLPQDFETINK